MNPIRKAKSVDAGAITRIQVNAWRKAYDHFMPSTLFDGLSLPSREVRWRSLIEDPTQRVYVWEQNAVPVGVVHYAIDLETSVTNITRLYVSPDHWGSGIGRALLALVFDESIRNKITEVFLWVAEQNESARKFYERFGFHLIADSRRIDAFSKDGGPLSALATASFGEQPDASKGEFAEVQYWKQV